MHPLPYQLAPVHTLAQARLGDRAGGCSLAVRRQARGPPAAMAFALLHLAGVALVAWAVLRVARRFLSWPDMISQILLVAMVLNVVAYVPSTLANATDLNAREFAVVLPFGAVLAGPDAARPASWTASACGPQLSPAGRRGGLLACYGS